MISSISYHASALPHHQVSMLGKTTHMTNSMNTVSDEHYAYVNHRNIQPDNLLPNMDVISDVPVSKKVLQFSSRASYLNWLSVQYSWDDIALSRLLHPGDSRAAVHEIHSRLILLGDSEESLRSSDVYTVEIAVAVRNFQRRHGRNADAIIGPDTLNNFPP